MKTVHNITLLGISLLLLTGLAACDKPGPAEATGKKLDTAANSAAMKIDETYDKAGEKLGEKSDQFGVAMDDAAITTKVKSAIYSEPGLKTLRISVDTIKGVVTLTGSVDSLSDYDRTSALAESVGGVRQVENRLQVKPTN
jgi:hyperosmotically inducible periplasmic protein